MIAIRPALPSDIPQMFEMLRAAAADQGFPDSLAVTEADLLEDGFGAHPRFQCAIAEEDRVAAGMALYFFNYSTWVSRRVLYLEDLYVMPQFRRAGVARALMQHLADVAKEHECRQMKWLVHRENESAIRLYSAFGARPLDDWMLMTIQQQAAL